MSLTSYPILRNFSFLAAAQVISALTGIITVAIVARALGPEAYGILGFSIAILAYLGLATNLGTDTHAAPIAQYESSLGAIAGIALTQRTIMAVFCLLSLMHPSNREARARVTGFLAYNPLDCFSSHGTWISPYRGFSDRCHSNGKSLPRSWS